MEPELKQKLKDYGLNAAEDHLSLAVKQVKDLGQILVDSTESTFDNVAFAAVLLLEGELLRLIDKVDGKEG